METIKRCQSAYNPAATFMPGTTVSTGCTSPTGYRYYTNFERRSLDESNYTTTKSNAAGECWWTTSPTRSPPPPPRNASSAPPIPPKVAQEPIDDEYTYRNTSPPYPPPPPPNAFAPINNEFTYKNTSPSYPPPPPPNVCSPIDDEYTYKNTSPPYPPPPPPNACEPRSQLAQTPHYLSHASATPATPPTTPPAHYTPYHSSSPTLHIPQCLSLEDSTPRTPPRSPPPPALRLVIPKNDKPAPLRIAQPLLPTPVNTLAPRASAGLKRRVASRGNAKRPRSMFHGTTPTSVYEEEKCQARKSRYSMPVVTTYQAYRGAGRETEAEVVVVEEVGEWVSYDEYLAANSASKTAEAKKPDVVPTVVEVVSPEKEQRSGGSESTLPELPDDITSLFDFCADVAISVSPPDAAIRRISAPVPLRSGTDDSIYSEEDDDNPNRRASALGLMTVLAEDAPRTPLSNSLFDSIRRALKADSDNEDDDFEFYDKDEDVEFKTVEEEEEREEDMEWTEDPLEVWMAVSKEKMAGRDRKLVGSVDVASL